MQNSFLMLHSDFKNILIRLLTLYFFPLVLFMSMMHCAQELDVICKRADFFSSIVPMFIF
jgi:hypothetical protein